MRIELLDIKGQLLCSFGFPIAMGINYEALPGDSSAPGNYLLRIKENPSMHFKKLVKIN